eukprot:CAMPEP_0172516954 /NCGR_PEP_ID=MMETSP1066-20121228/280384_1 /TAXON_ID=671091 /ORGANISM="Coscinodiscus wailesii, Strain CCMP2513" /LENGTH=457 /DNA_ID=CAMNT_0013298667 /DNA_START=74 /DNA_END=1444 /DNA_ORIENTATION=+
MRTNGVRKGVLLLISPLWLLSSSPSPAQSIDIPTPHRASFIPKTKTKISKNAKAAVLLPSRGGSEDSGGASITSSVFNLVNNVAGAGILTLAAGKAKGTGWIPSILLCTVLGGISAHTFMLIGKACEMTGEKDFKGLWSLTMGSNTTYMVDSMIAILCTACAIIYSGILGDVFTPLLASAGLPSHLNSRSSNIILLTTFVLFPLGLIKNLSALAFTSILGFCAIAYTVVFIVYRFLDGSYDTMSSGRFVVPSSDGAEAIVLPSFAKSTMWNFDFSSLVLASNLGLAYIAHYNAPTFYRELKDTSAKRFNVMVSIAFVILTLLYITTMSAGYATFGDVCEGNILLNYHPGDVLSTLGRVATGFSILFGFPLVLCGVRESVSGVAATLYNIQLEKYHTLLVTAILAFVTAISVAVTDVSLVVGLTGAVMGSFIVYICPALVYSKIPGAGKANLALIPFG